MKNGYQKGTALDTRRAAPPCPFVVPDTRKTRNLERKKERKIARSTLHLLDGKISWEYLLIRNGIYFLLIKINS